MQNRGDERMKNYGKFKVDEEAAKEISVGEAIELQHPKTCQCIGELKVYEMTWTEDEQVWVKVKQDE